MHLRKCERLFSPNRLFMYTFLCCVAYNKLLTFVFLSKMKISKSLDRMEKIVSRYAQSILCFVMNMELYYNLKTRSSLLLRSSEDLANEVKSSSPFSQPIRTFYSKKVFVTTVWLTKSERNRAQLGKWQHP